MYDKVKFIQIVQENPIVYDCNHEDYSNRSLKMEIWNEIADKMESHDGTWWAAKWKILKDNYNKYKKSRENATADSYKNYKNWPWAKNLNFLDEFPNKSFQINDASYGEIKPKKRKECKAESNRENKLFAKSKIIKTTSMNPADRVLEYLKMRNEQRTKMDEVDCYFQSYAKTFKRLPTKSQIKLRLEMAKLFTKYELENIDDNIPEDT